MIKKLALIAGLIILLVSVPLGIFLVNQQQELRLKAAPATVVSLTPSSGSFNAGQVFNVDVNVDTGQNVITSVDLVLNYNPTLLEAQSISLGSFLSGATPVRAPIIDNTKGQITYSFYVMKENAKSGVGTLATVKFTAKAAGDATVAFDPQKNGIYGLDETQNVVRQSAPGAYTIASAVATSSPVPTATASPAASSTASPTSAATASPAPTSSSGGGTSTQSPNPTKSPTKSPSSTSMPVTGMDLPTVVGIVAGIVLLIGGALLLAF